MDIKWLQLRYNHFDYPFFIYRLDKEQLTNAAFFVIANTHVGERLHVFNDGVRIYEKLERPISEYRCARLIGNILGISKDFLAEMVEILFNSDQVDVIDLFYYSDDQHELMGSFSGLPVKIISNRMCDLYNGEIGNNSNDSLSINLATSLEEQLASFKTKKSHRYNIKNIQRVKRKAEVEHDMQLKSFYHECGYPSISERELEWLAQIDDNSWQKGKQSIYITRADKQALSETIIHLFEKKCLLLCFCLIDDYPVSYVLGILANNNVCQFSLAYDARFRKLSVGKLAFIHFIQTAIEIGLKKIECAGTRHQYKTDLVTFYDPVHESALFNPIKKNAKTLYKIKKLYPIMSISDL